MTITPWFPMHENYAVINVSCCKSLSDNLLQQQQEAYIPTFMPNFFFGVVVFLFSFLLKLLGWHWLTKLYSFQAHNFIKCHLHNVLCVHHYKANLHPLPFSPPLPFSTPHIPCPWAIALFSVSMIFFSFFPFLLIHFTHCHPAVPPTIPDSCQPVLYLWVCLYLVC